jgi:hypothetical protein
MAKSMSELGDSARGARIFGFPLEGFSLFQGLLLAFASAFLTFFATTCIAIFALLIWSLFDPQALHHAADTYLYVGFPAGVLVLVVALPLFLALWVRAKARK